MLTYVSKLFDLLSPKPSVRSLVSVDKLRLKMQKFANEPNYNSAVACFIVENDGKKGDRLTLLAATDESGEDGITRGENASRAAHSVLSVVETVSKQLFDAGRIQEAQIYLEKGFLTLRTVEIEDVLIQNKMYIKTCLFAFLYTDTNALTRRNFESHTGNINHIMGDQPERTKNPDGSVTERILLGLRSLSKPALEEYYNRQL